MSVSEWRVKKQAVQGRGGARVNHYGVQKNLRGAGGSAPGSGPGGRAPWWGSGGEADAFLVLKS